MKCKIRLLAAGCAMFLLFMQMPTFAATNESKDYIYRALVEAGYQVSVGETGRKATGVMQLIDGDAQPISAYCIDAMTNVVSNHPYSILNLDDCTYLSAAARGRVRAILFNSYPFMSIAEIQNESGKSVSKQDAITATQLAIWSVTNGVNYPPYSPPPNEAAIPRVTGLRDWYLSLPGRMSTGKIADITITSRQTAEGLHIAYSADAKNTSGTDVALVCTLPTGVVGIQQPIDANGVNHILVKNPVFPMPISVSGVQAVQRNAYLYQPDGGANRAQSMAGINGGNVNIKKTAVLVAENAEDGVQISKTDSHSGSPMAGVEFWISQDPTFAGAKQTMITNAQGTAILKGLAAGKWYLKESKTPAGYLPMEGNHEVTVTKGIVSVAIKNTRESSIKIIKQDEGGVVLPNGIFSIYEGTGITGTLLYDNLTTNAQGFVLQGKLTAGTYTILEKQAPAGYEKLTDPFTVTLDAGMSKEIIFKNRLIPIVTTGTIHLFKHDAADHTLQLEGTKFAIYQDAAMTHLLREITSLKTGPAIIDALPAGTYYIKETEVTPGYVLDAPPQTVVVRAGETTTVRFYNNKIIVTAGNYATLLLAGLMMLGGCGLGWVNLYAARKRAK